MSRIRKSSCNMAIGLYQVTHSVECFSPFTCHYPTLQLLRCVVLYSDRAQFTISTSYFPLLAQVLNTQPLGNKLVLGIKLFISQAVSDLSKLWLLTHSVDYHTKGDNSSLKN